MTTIIYGAGRLGRTIYTRVKNDFKDNDILWADGNASLWDTYVFGHQVINPEEIVNIAFDRIVIASAQGLNSIKECLTLKLNIPNEKIDANYISNLYDRTFETRNRWLTRFSNIIYSRNIEGNCAEGGVFEGSFAKKINEAFPDRTLYLFDTFTGFDSRDINKEPSVSENARTGEFNIHIDIDTIKAKMVNPDNVIIKKGYFPDTADGIFDNFVFVNLDFDLYAPTLSGLKFFYPMIVQGGVILIHDYFHDCMIGKNYAFEMVRTAVDEFCTANGVFCIPIGDECSVALVKH